MEVQGFTFYITSLNEKNRQSRMTDSRDYSVARKFAWFALSGFTLFTVSAVLIQVVRPDLDPLEATLSMYMIGPHGWLLTLGFVGLALGVVSLTLGIRRTLYTWAPNETGILLLLLLALGVFIVAVFPTDLPGAKHTAAGRLHNLGAYVVFFSFPFVALSLSRVFGKDRRWRPVYRSSWTLFLIYTALLIITLLIFEGFHATGYFGAFQRCLILLILLWFFIVIGRLLKMTSGHQ